MSTADPAKEVFARVVEAIEPYLREIPNPASYIVQKVLALPDRLKPEKDFLYIHDTFRVFANALPDIREAWEHLQLEMSPAHVLRFRRSAKRLFANITDACRGAARIASMRALPPSPEELLATCRAGHRRIFEEPDGSE